MKISPPLACLTIPDPSSSCIGGKDLHLNGTALDRHSRFCAFVIARRIRLDPLSVSGYVQANESTLHHEVH